jgi:hypothetical protein
MSLPASETIPDDYSQLPPAQKRRIRHSLRSAGESEIQSLLLELKRRSTPGYDFFLLAILGAVLMGIALILGSPILFIAAAICVPILTPLMGISISPALRYLPFLLQSVASQLICVVLYFGFGSLAGFIARAVNQSANFQLPIYAQSNWIGWVVLVITAILAGILMLRYEINAHLPGILISFLVFTPIAAAGFFLTNGSGEPWGALLLLGLTYLACSAFLIMLTFLILGLTPRKSIGWLIFLVAGIAFILLLIFSRGAKPPLEDMKIQPSISTPCPVATCSTDTEESVCLLPIVSTPTVKATETQTPEPTLTSTVTPNPTATPVLVTVRADTGAVIREGPGYDYPIAAYASDGSQIQMLDETFLNGTIEWVKVIANDGTIGWILKSLLIIPIP